jgi:hypothetical protein
MSIIIIEGPEKAGKSTLVEAIASVPDRLLVKRVKVRHWVGRATPDDRLYSEPLREDASIRFTEGLTVWDRGWPSEYVYGTLLRQTRRLAADPWLGEWLHGRAAAANGLRVMLTGPSPAELATRRDSSDLDVDPASERLLYMAYAHRFNWLVLRPEPIELMVSRVIDAYLRVVDLVAPLPPTFAGPTNSSVIIIGEDRAGASMTPGGWLPFSSHLTTKLARLLGDRAMRVGWTNAHDCPPSALRGAKTLVACGARAQQWVERYVMQEGGRQELIRIPHPSHVFRFNNSVTQRTRPTVIQTISQLEKDIQ